MIEAMQIRKSYFLYSQVRNSPCNSRYIYESVLLQLQIYNGGQNHPVCRNLEDEQSLIGVNTNPFYWNEHYTFLFQR